MRLTKKQETALLASIKKWKANANARQSEKVYTGGDNCPLCQEFFLKGESPCTSCPVYLKTKLDSCVNTPYFEARRRLYDWRDAVIYCAPMSEINAAKKAWRKAALAEVAFLRSLLPAKHPQR